MTARRFASAVSIIWMIFATAGISGQSSQDAASAAGQLGVLPYSSTAGDRENISLSSGDVSLYIPLLTDVGKGGQTFTLAVTMDNHSAYSLQANSNGTGSSTWVGWQPTGQHILSLAIPRLTADVSQVGTNTVTCPWPIGSTTVPIFATTNFVFTDERGTSHSFGNKRDYTSLTNGNSGCSYTTWQSVNIQDAIDGSFLRLDTTNANDMVVYTQSGTQYHFSGLNTGLAGATNTGQTPLAWWYNGLFSRIVDPHGNTITGQVTSATPDQYTFTITDSVGRIMTDSYVSSGEQIGYTDSSGTQRTFLVSTPASLTYATSTVQLPYPVAGGCRIEAPGSPQNGNTVNANGDPVWPANSSPPQVYAPNVLLETPTGGSYEVYFNNIGEIVKISYPGGGYTKYDYGSYRATYDMGTAICDGTYREIIAKHECGSSDGTCQSEDTTVYSPVLSSNAGVNSSVDVTDPAGNLTRHKFETFVPYQLSKSVSAREIERDEFSGQSSQLRSIVTSYIANSHPTSQLDLLDMSLPETVTTILTDVSPNKSSKIKYTYDTVSILNCNQGCIAPQAPFVVHIGNPIQIDEYDFDATGATKTTQNTWMKSGIFSISANHILNSLNTTTSTGSGGTATTTYDYYPSSPNMKTKTVTGKDLSPIVEQYTSYDAYGDLTSYINPLNVSTRFGYSSPWFDSNCVQSTDSGGRPTNITNALNQVTTLSYYSCTGLLAQTIDPNNVTTTYTYDSLGRIHTVTAPDMGMTTTNYVDAAPQSIAKSTTMNSTVNITTNTDLDGYSRVISTHQTSDPAGTMSVDTAYDNRGQIESVSVPHRGSDSSAFTVYDYDPLGRISSQTASDGISKRRWDYSSNTVTVTDERASQSQYTVDAFGRLTRVMEPDPLTGVPLIETDYKYDALDNLTNVTQNGKPGEAQRVRKFQYDSLSRLGAAFNPEKTKAGMGSLSCMGSSGWTECYTYDSNGNLQTRTDDRGITTTYSYDILNRLRSKTYTDGSPSVCMQYDASTYARASANLIGRLTNEWTQAGSCPSTPPATGFFTLRSLLAYDLVGRLTSERQCMSTNCFTQYSPTLGYSYDLAGHIITLGSNVAQPFSLLTISNGYDAAGRANSVLTEVRGLSGFYPLYTVPSNGFGPFGPTNWTLGSNLSVTQTYNNRGWIQNITATGQVPR